GAFVSRYQGVYALAPACMDPQALIAAAVLAGGPTPVASHASAAWLWEFARHFEAPPAISLPTGIAATPHHHPSLPVVAAPRPHPRPNGLAVAHGAGPDA